MQTANASVFHTFGGIMPHDQMWCRVQNNTKTAYFAIGLEHSAGHSRKLNTAIKSRTKFPTRRIALLELEHG